MEPSPSTTTCLSSLLMMASILEHSTAVADALFGSACSTITNDVKGNSATSENFTTSIALHPSGTSARFNVKIYSTFAVGLVANNTLNPPAGSKYSIIFATPTSSKVVIRYVFTTSGPLATSIASFNLDPGNYRAVWVSWADGVIAAGNGTIVGQNLLVNFTDKSPSAINYLLVGAYNTAGSVYTTYCYQQHHKDQTFPLNSPDMSSVMSTALDCGRACSNDPQCQGFALDRDVIPFGHNYVCSIFYSISGLRFDPQHVLYVLRNATT